MLALAEMYIKGVSARDVGAVMREFGIEESLSSSQVSRANKSALPLSCWMRNCRPEPPRVWRRVRLSLGEPYDEEKT